MTDLSLEEMAEFLTQSKSYKVLKCFEKIQQYSLDNNKKKRIGVFLDIESTGLNTLTDKIIEVALVPFEYSDDGLIYKVLESYSSFQNPGLPIPSNITSITGITNEMVKDQEIDLAVVKKIIDEADIIIAHNAAFDRKMFENQLFKTNKLWACTFAQIPWREEGINSAKLEYIAFILGFFYKAHRAEVDCLVGIHILAQPLPLSSKPTLKVLLENAIEKSYRIWAVNTNYDAREVLKARRYRWNFANNNQPRAWYIEVKESDKEEELIFLYNEIYKQKVQLPIEEIDALDRFQ